MIGFVFKVVVGALLWLFSPQFRALVRRKLHGLDDVVQHGEDVTAVLVHVDSGSKQTIGGAR